MKLKHCMGLVAMLFVVFASACQGTHEESAAPSLGQESDSEGREGDGSKNVPGESDDTEVVGDPIVSDHGGVIGSMKQIHLWAEKTEIEELKPTGIKTLLNEPNQKETFSGFRALEEPAHSIPLGIIVKPGSLGISNVSVTWDDKAARIVLNFDFSGLKAFDRPLVLDAESGHMAPCVPSSNIAAGLDGSGHYEGSCETQSMNAYRIVATGVDGKKIEESVKLGFDAARPWIETDEKSCDVGQESCSIWITWRIEIPFKLEIGGTVQEGTFQTSNLHDEFRLEYWDNEKKEYVEIKPLQEEKSQFLAKMSLQHYHCRLSVREKLTGAWRRSNGIVLTFHPYIDAPKTVVPGRTYAEIHIHGMKKVTLTCDGNEKSYGELRSQKNSDPLPTPDRRSWILEGDILSLSNDVNHFFFNYFRYSQGSDATDLVCRFAYTTYNDLEGTQEMVYLASPSN